ncbi:ribosomal-processing cysteine protease Prp [Streptomyces xanthophaeus]|uniref:ribosomal-processing cysteine protease Prp n=1 Tax=Streptomyces xanthophaeus TaxID=67385 RepID=UPI0036807B6E
MIRIRAHLGNGHTSIEVEGHEEHAEAGRVCAAVSAITQTALLGLEQVALQHPDLVSVEITQE